MADQQRLFHPGQSIEDVLSGEIVEELLLDGERPAGKRHRRDALRFDLIEMGGEVMRDVRGVGRCCDRHDACGLRHVRRGGKHGGAAEAVADQQCRRGKVRAQEIDRRQQVLHVRREIRVGELAFAAADAGEVETKDRDAARGEALCNPRGRENVLAAGKAMGKQRKCARVRRQVQPGRKHCAGRARKLDLSRLDHVGHPRCRRRKRNAGAGTLNVPCARCAADHSRYRDEIALAGDPATAKV